MKNLERAKKFQSMLYSAIGREWKEEDFDDRWIYKPFGADWDFWYEKNLVPTNFCALCGEDQIRDDVFISNNHSKYGVRIYLCEGCAKSKGYPVSETPAQQESTPRSYLLKHFFTFFGTVLFWYFFLPKGLIHLVPVLLVSLPNWFGGWLASVTANERTFLMLTPLIVSKNVNTVVGVIRAMKFLAVGAVIWAFYLSTSTGIVTIIAAIWAFFAFPFYWMQLQKKRGWVGT